LRTQCGVLVSFQATGVEHLQGSRQKRNSPRTIHANGPCMLIKINVYGFTNLHMDVPFGERLHIYKSRMRFTCATLLPTNTAALCVSLHSFSCFPDSLFDPVINFQLTFSMLLSMLPLTFEPTSIGPFERA